MWKSDVLRLSGILQATCMQVYCYCNTTTVIELQTCTENVYGCCLCVRYEGYARSSTGTVPAVIGQYGSSLFCDVRDTRCNYTV